MENLSTAITTAVGTVSDVMGSAIDLAVSNPLCMIFIVGGLVGVGIGLFKQLKDITR